jgi:hypothetical protein
VIIPACGVCTLQAAGITVVWNTSKPSVLEFIKIISTERMNYWHWISTVGMCLHW